jgi:Transposase DDE domain/Transposase domain (DUF772)
MQSTLRERLQQFSHLNQTVLFERLERQVGALSEKTRLLVSVLGMITLSRWIAPSRGWRGRPSKDRQALATAFLAKAILGLETTRQLLERLQTDPQLRCLCGWPAGEVPHEATFSRAFAEFARSELPQRLHEALIKDTQQGRLVGHIARDSTAIEARERFDKLPKHRPIAKRRSGRPRKAERSLSGRRLPRQRRQTLQEMLGELPRHCSLGVKKSSKGYQQYWRGYKLHLDVADGQIPISGLLTAASLHDSQAAIPLATLTAQRVTSLYDLMDCAYDAGEIHEHSRSLGHVPLIAPGKQTVPIVHRTFQESLRRYNKHRALPRSLSRKRPPFTPAQEQRFHIRTMSERVNARLKDEFGGRTLRVRGAGKIMAHLMFGILALTVDQLLRLTG